MGHCSVIGCKYSQKQKSGKHYKLFRFPKEEPYKSEWLKVCNPNVNARNARICSRHFEEQYFFKPLIQQMLGYSPVRHRNIKTEAVPTLYLTNNSDVLYSPANAETIMEVDENLLNNAEECNGSPNIPESVPEKSFTSVQERDDDVLQCRDAGIDINVLLEKIVELSQQVENLQRDVGFYKRRCFPPKKEKFVAISTEIKSEIEDQLVDSPDDFLYEDDPSLQVAAHLDHDYVAVQKSAEELLLESRQKQLEERNVQKVLENVKRELCRICGQKGQDLTPIFEISLKDKEDDLDLSAKVAMHLPLKVERSDTLPLHICQTCSDLLTSWHELYVTCIAADAILQKTFGNKKSEVLSDTSPNIIGRTDDKMEHPVTNNVLGDNVNTSLEMDSSPLNEAEEICEICGLSRSGEAKNEGTEFQNVFDNIENIDTKHPYLCKICRDPFGSTMDRRNHFMMCRQLATICDICGAEVKHRKDLTRHKFIAHFRKKVKPVVKIQMCDRCGKCFKSRNALRVHRCAGENSSPKHVCKSCCSLFSNDLYYAKHMKRHEKGKVKLAFPPGTFMINEDTASHICPVCQEEFDSELSLAIHLTSKKQMKCVMCKKKVANEKHFMLHSCKKWVCRLCDKSFCEKLALDNHESIHRGEKSYKCNLCDGTFRTPNALTRHQTVHNPTLLNCTFCSKVFKRKYSYRDHVNSHLGFYLSCKFCEKQFSSRISLYRHTVRFHRNKKELS